MTPGDDALQRLFRAAASAPEEPVPERMPVELENRILSHRREWLARAAGEEFGAVLTLIRRGLAAAALIAIVTALICHRLDDGRLPPVDSMILESVAELSLLP